MNAKLLATVNPDILYPTGFGDSVMGQGVNRFGRMVAVMDMARVVEQLITKKHGMDEESALEHIEYNMIQENDEALPLWYKDESFYSDGGEIAHPFISYDRIMKDKYTLQYGKSRKDFFLPMARIFREAKGVVYNCDIDHKIFQMFMLNIRDLKAVRPDSSRKDAGKPVFKDECQWVRSYLRRAGYIRNCGHESWVATDLLCECMPESFSELIKMGNLVA